MTAPIVLDLDAIEAAAKAAALEVPSNWLTRSEEALLAAMMTPSTVLELVRRLRAAELATASFKVPSFYWVSGDEGSWNSPEEWANDYYANSGEKPKEVTLSCAVELPPIKFDCIDFDIDGNCIGLHATSA